MVKTRALGQIRRPRIWPETALTPEEKRAVDQLIGDYRASMFELRGLRGRLIKPIAIALIKNGWRRRSLGVVSGALPFKPEAP